MAMDGETEDRIVKSVHRLIKHGKNNPNKSFLYTQHNSSQLGKYTITRKFHMFDVIKIFWQRGQKHHY